MYWLRHNYEVNLVHHTNLLLKEVRIEAGDYRGLITGKGVVRIPHYADLKRDIKPIHD